MRATKCQPVDEVSNGYSIEELKAKIRSFESNIERLKRMTNVLKLTVDSVEKNEKANTVKSKGIDMESHTQNGPLEKQIGGDHYKKLKIQPTEFCEINSLGYCQSSVIKYLTRRKNNRMEDMKKARHFIEMLLSFVDIPCSSSISRIQKQTSKLWKITPEKYCDENRLEENDRKIIVSVCRFKTVRELKETLVFLDHCISESK